MASNSSSYDYTNPLNLLSAGIMVLIPIFGTICNALIIYIFASAQSERTSFNLICVSRSVGNTIILIWLFIFTFLPITLRGTSPFSPIYETIAIVTCNNIYLIVEYGGVLIAFNRFCAMFFPFFYSKYFNIKITSVMLIGVWIYKMVDTVIYMFEFLTKDCYTLYSPYYLAWVPNTVEGCYPYSISPVNGTALIVIILVVMNIATFSKIYFFFKSTATEKAEIKRKTRQNKILYFQTLFQDVITFIDMIFTFKLSRLSTERYWTFISGSLVYMCVHASDGLVMVMFNERLSFIKKKLFHIEKSNSNIFVMTSMRRRSGV